MGNRTAGSMVFVLGLLQVTTTAAAAPEWVAGDWIGGFESTSGTVYVSAHFRGEGDEVEGTIDLPIKGDLAIAMEDVKVGERAVNFEVRGPVANLLFEGKRRDERRVSGSVRQAFATSSFELLKLATPTKRRIDALCGNYEIEPGRVVLITRNGESLMYFDSTAGRLGILFPLDEGTFVAGPTVASGYPVELTVRVAEEQEGIVQAVTWQRKGRPPQRAPRRTLYRSEQLGFYNGSIRLSGTLLLPNGPGPHPAVVMVHGSGPATRDGLRPWADVYARSGYAVLIHDKRGTGASTGNWARATFDDLAGDALAAIAYLRSRAEIDPAQVGLHGMSMGSWVAPLAAERSGQVAFVIVESASALTPLEHERNRVQHQLRADGFSREVVARALALMDQKFEVARTGQGWDDLQAQMRRAAEEGWANYVNPPQTLESLQWHWQHVLSYDPMPALQKLACPVLVLYGGLDSIVPPDLNRARMQSVLEKSRTRDVTIKVFDRANHSFLEAVTGGRREGPSLRGFVDGYLETHVAWLGERVRRNTGFAPIAGTDTAFDEALTSLLPSLAIPNGAAPSYLPRPARTQ
jgi:dienelactone hydrolase